jgi:hypothetical protein
MHVFFFPGRRRQPDAFELGCLSGQLFGCGLPRPRRRQDPRAAGWLVTSMPMIGTSSSKPRTSDGNIEHAFAKHGPQHKALRQTSIDAHCTLHTNFSSMPCDE